MKNVLTATLIATTLAGAAAAQPATPGELSEGGMQQVPTLTPTADDETRMPDGTIVDLETPQAGTSGTVRVRMPNGELVDVPDTADAPWWKDNRLQGSGLTSFYFDPANRVYVVRGDTNPDNWPKKNWGVE